MKKILSFLVAMLFATTISAQIDEVTLTVIGTGQNEESATLQALRSAIEQSFGTFVSANTTILNNELVQDEIVSTTNGNVKEYQKLAVTALPNGQVSVSLKATVSINKLISYAKSKGSRAEFAGQTYAANVKLLRLKASSAKKVYQLMVEQLESIAKDMFTFELQIVGAPKICDVERIGKVYSINLSINIMSDIASTNFYNLYYNTIKSIELTKEEVLLCSNNGINITYVNDPAQYGLHEQDYRLKDPKSCWIPLRCDYYCECQKRIADAIYSALHRYTVSEIGDPKNNYYYVACNCDNGCIPICIGINELNRKAAKGDYQLYSKKWDERIFAYGHTKGNFLGAGAYNDYSSCHCGKGIYDEFFSKFALTEIRTPIQLSRKEQKEVERGTYKGATYTTSYTNPKILKTHKISVAIPVNKIESFQGFEIKL